MRPSALLVPLSRPTLKIAILPVCATFGNDFSISGSPRNSLSDFAHPGCLIGEMNDKSDTQLLREFADAGSESAFREIVVRHADLLYSSALRQIGSPDLARDVIQTVFTDLARKACSIASTMKPE